MSPSKKFPRKRGYYVKRADDAFSLWIRKRDKEIFGDTCPLCNQEPIQCAFHWVKRGHFATRWDEENVIGACHSCNFLMEYDPSKFFAWHVAKYGPERLQMLVARGRQHAKFSNADLEEITAKYTERLKQ